LFRGFIAGCNFRGKIDMEEDKSGKNEKEKGKMRTDEKANFKRESNF
jgi:hypothetical protein